MTKTLKWLGGGVAAVMLLGLAGLFSGEVAEAQPSGPPHRFAGSVTLDGEAAAAGTSVTAVVNGATCGSATVIESAAGSTYVVDVLDNCADDGDTVSFQVGGYDAAESRTWSGGGRTDLDLSASSAMPEMPEDDMADDMADDDMAEECPDDMGEGDMPDEPAEPGDDMPDEPAEPGDDMAGDCPSDDMADDMDDDMADDDMDDDMADDDMADDDMDDDMADDMDDDMADDDMAPEVADTGTGLATTSSSLAAILGVTALAILLGSYTFARRRR